MKLSINDLEHEVPAGCSVAAALARAGLDHTRISETGKPRTAFCGMGQCQECRVRIDGVANRLACMTPAVEGMVVQT
jgi:predicted molibdopterin-dependent oxidoreductase YjgC